MTFAIAGRVGWEGDRDEDGYRTYKLVHLLVSDVPTDGPAEALRTPGLPLPGALWQVGTDVDVWVYCRPNALMQPFYDAKEPGVWWTIEQTFSNKPPPKGQRCQDQEIEDPLLEPPKISGGFQRDKEEATRDRYGLPINNSSHEQIRGPQNEWDASRPKIRVQMNLPFSEEYLALLSALQDCVNESPMWGYGPRMVKLSGSDWTEQLFGLCYFYLQVTFDFEINWKTWDRYILDEGTKCLRGDWDRDPDSPDFTKYVVAKRPPPDDDQDLDASDPKNFIRHLDWNGQATRVILDGNGRPFDPENPNQRVERAEVEPPEGTGTDYVTGEFVTIDNTGATVIQEPEFAIDAVGENGEILSLSLVQGGIYQTPPTNPVAVLGGSGVDATVNLFFTPQDEAGKIKVEKYLSANLFALGIPAQLGQNVPIPPPPPPPP